MTEAGKGKKLTPSLFFFSIRKCFQKFFTGKKKNPPLIYRITPKHKSKSAFLKIHPLSGVR
ncbi:hypothetical protein, partial [Salmonella enterica]|uniref:hypothetical protein n=1 Tax=Salmonella enterica TaxID=28901 RepID=UPI001E52F555